MGTTGGQQRCRPILAVRVSPTSLGWAGTGSWSLAAACEDSGERGVVAPLQAASSPSIICPVLAYLEGGALWQQDPIFIFCVTGLL